MIRQQIRDIHFQIMPNTRSFIFFILEDLWCWYLQHFPTKNLGLVTQEVSFFFFNPLQFYSPISLRARSAFKVQPADHVIRKLEALCFRRLRNQSFGCGRNSSEGNLSSCSTSTLAQCWLLLHRPLVNPHIDMDVDNLHGCPSVRERERATQRPGLHYS